MAQTKIVLADYDASYLSTLERVFVREYQFTAEIVLLSNEAAVRQYFEEPKTIDILVIGEHIYGQAFVRHNIGHLFLLADTEPTPETAGELYGNMVYKYISGKRLIDTVISRSGLSHATNMHSGVAKVVMVFSPAGGAGQTTLSAGLCTLIAKNFRRVLFVGTDNLQTFGYILQNGQRLQAGTEKTLQQKNKYVYEKIKPMIVSELFDIVPPFSAALASLSITPEHLLFLLNIIKGAGDYDFIVIDGGADFTEGTTQMMAFADQVLLVTEQDKNAVYKLHCLLDTIDYSNSSRFMLVCNKYRPDSETFLNFSMGRSYPHTEFVEFDANITPDNSEYLANLQSMQKLMPFFI